MTVLADLFDAGAAGVLAGRLVRVLAGVAADPGVRVHEVAVLGAAERRAVVAGWNDTAVAVAGGTLGGLFEGVAGGRPDAVAVVAGGGQVCYGELNGRANRLARVLVARGAAPESVVAVVLERGAGLVVALLAVAKAGAAFLLVDPGYPAGRISYLLGDARPVLVLTDGAIAGELPGLVGVPVVVVDGAGAAAGAWWRGRGMWGRGSGRGWWWRGIRRM